MIDFVNKQILLNTNMKLNLLISRLIDRLRIAFLDNYLRLNLR
jgi:hypothetical protein